MKYSLKGMSAIITGASRGLGLEIARKYLAAGANLFLVAQDLDLLNAVYKELIVSAAHNQHISFCSADISCEREVVEVVRKAFECMGGIHILVNNAGIYGPMGLSEEVDLIELRRAIDVNLFGSIMMFRSVAPYFKKQSYGKIIQLSGGGATSPMPFISAYAASKTAIVRYMESISKELYRHNIYVNSVAPGPLNTQMLQEVLDAGPSAVGREFYEKSLLQKKKGVGDFSRATELILFLGSKLSDGISGKLISAIWDDWENWHGEIDQIMRADTYTIRRIT